MVTPSSIPSSTTEMPDIEMSPNEVSDEVLKDLDEEPIVMTKVSDSKDSSPKDINTLAAGISLLLPVLLSTLRPSPSHKKITNCSADTKRLEELTVSNTTIEPLHTEPNTSHFFIDPCCPILFALFPYL